MIKRIVIVLTSLLLLLCSCTPAQRSPELTVVFADVGKADFILVCCDGKFGVIDAGYKSSKEKIDEVMTEYGVKTLEFAVATHNDKDHIGGMAHILEKYGAKTLYVTRLEGEGKQYINMLDAAAIKGIPVVKLKRNETVPFCGAEFTVLSPDDSLIELKDENEASLVLRMQYGKNSVLFMGDAQIKAEEKLISNYKDELVCDAIKIGHHGSVQASSRVFLSKTKAKYAIISTGDEEPASELTLNAVSACNMQLYNTDNDGDILLKTDGVNLTVTKKGG